MGVFLGVAGPPEVLQQTPPLTLSGEPFQHLTLQQQAFPGCRVLRGRSPSSLDPPVHTPAPGLMILWDGTLLERGWSFREFRATAEATRHLLARPHQALNEVKGWFAMAAYDAQQHRLVLATDWMGIRPVFYRWDEDHDLLWFGTLLGPLKPGAPDLAGLAEYFFLNYPLRHRTLHRNLARLPSGHYLVWSPGNAPEIHAYYSHADRLFSQELRPEIGRRQIVEAFIETTRALANSTTGLLLTGGFDSRVVLAALQSAPGVQVHALTFGDPASGNVSTARKVAERAGVRFQNLDPNPVFRREFYHWARINTLATDGLEVATKAHYLWALSTVNPPPPVLLSGTGGSELFRQTGVLGTIYSPLLLSLLESAHPPTLEQLATLPQARWLHVDTFTEDARAGLRQDLAALLQRPPHERIAYFHVFNLAELFPRYFENEMRVEQLYTVKRYPFLDLDFVELVFASAAVSPLRAHLFKKSRWAPLKRLRFYTEVLQKTLPALARMETDRGIRPDYASHPWGLIRSLIGYWRFQRHRPPGEYRFGEWLEHFPLAPRWPCEPPVRRQRLTEALQNLRGTPRAFPLGASRALTYCLWQELLHTL